MKKAIIQNDIIGSGSLKHRRIYAKEGDEVTIIDVRKPAVIVEDKYGKRFAVHEREIK